MRIEKQQSREKDIPYKQFSGDVSLLESDRVQSWQESLIWAKKNSNLHNALVFLLIRVSIFSPHS